MRKSTAVYTLNAIPHAHTRTHTDIHINTLRYLRHSLVPATLLMFAF